MITHLFFGSIGVLVESSDIQRRSYNRALREAGLDWHWDEPTYRRLLTTSGGRERLRLLADATATTLDDATIEQIHARKTELACAEIVESKPPLRAGVAELISLALDRGIRLGLVTTTYRPNVAAIDAAAGDALPLDRFDVVVTRDHVAVGKPAPDAYRYALDTTGADPSTSIAIEDTATSALAARTAGLTTIVTPGQFTDHQIVVGADLVVPALGTGDGLDPAVLALVDG